MHIPNAAVLICSLHPSLDNPQGHSLITAFTYKKSYYMANLLPNRAEQEEIALNYTKYMQAVH